MHYGFDLVDPGAYRTVTVAVQAVCRTSKKTVSVCLSDLRKVDGHVCRECSNSATWPGARQKETVRALETMLKWRQMPKDLNGYQDANAGWDATCMDCDADTSPMVGNLRSRSRVSGC